MVSNNEISQRLRNKREGKSLNGYLVCNKCGGYYELQPGESWKEFDTECQCGGQLVQSATDSLMPYISEEEYERKMYSTEILIAYLMVVVFCPAAIILGIYLITRDNKTAKSNGKIVLLISCVLFFIVFGISGLLIYNAYFHQSAVNQYQDIASVRPSIRSTRLILTCFGI